MFVYVASAPLNIADMSICNVQKLVSNVFDNEKYMIHYENLKHFLRLGLKLKIYIAY